MGHLAVPLLTPSAFILAAIAESAALARPAFPPSLRAPFLLIFCHPFVLTWCLKLHSEEIPRNLATLGDASGFVRLFNQRNVLLENRENLEPFRFLRFVDVLETFPLVEDRSLSIERPTNRLEACNRLVCGIPTNPAEPILRFFVGIEGTLAPLRGLRLFRALRLFQLCHDAYSPKRAGNGIGANTLRVRRTCTFSVFKEHGECST